MKTFRLREQEYTEAVIAFQAMRRALERAELDAQRAYDVIPSGTANILIKMESAVRVQQSIVGAARNAMVKAKGAQA